MQIFFLPSSPHLYHSQDHHLISKSLKLLCDWNVYIQFNLCPWIAFLLLLHFCEHLHVSGYTRVSTCKDACTYLEVMFSFHHVNVMNAKSGMGKPKC